MLEGDYFVKRKANSLPDGYEYQPNRFVDREFGPGGFYVRYRSQEGDMRQLMNGNIPVYVDGLVDCKVDFVPDTHREQWVQLQKLGKCYLSFDGSDAYGSWYIIYPENPSLEFNQDGPDNTADAIDDLMFDIDFSHSILHNGYRWFDCRDITNFKKISDDEARKLMQDGDSI